MIAFDNYHFILTNSPLEPGYYKENDFGIRIEDIAVTVPATTKVHPTNWGPELCKTNAATTKGSA